ncbi:MAG: hypothetical protein FJX40_13915 [Alphaproteobacteria bacterium]|nr:hypothetical protein [Alphaproteobacteria bacterium]MBM3641850.1 hypothetical protein [Alphaproteobacteria bacterium]
MTEAEQAARDLLIEMQSELTEAYNAIVSKDETIHSQATELEALRAEKAALDADTSLTTFVGEMRAWFDGYRAAKAAIAQPQEQPTG